MTALRQGAGLSGKKIGSPPGARTPAKCYDAAINRCLVGEFGLYKGPTVRHLLRIAIVLAGLLSPAVCLAAEPLPRSVLVIDQSDRDTPWPLIKERAA